MSERTYLVAGLGNIGAEYAGTRHNIGFMILDAWAQASNVVFETKRYGDIAEISAKGRKFILLKPSTYMNLSGNAVRYWMNQLEVPLENVMVICDDLNLPFGTTRLRPGGSDGGHNGLKNITELLETGQFARLRFGIGNDFARGQQIDYVLSEFSDEEKKIITESAKKVSDAIQTWAFSGINIAMNAINAKNR